MTPFDHIFGKNDLKVSFSNMIPSGHVKMTRRSHLHDQSGLSLKLQIVPNLKNVFKQFELQTQLNLKKSVFWLWKSAPSSQQDRTSDTDCGLGLANN